MASTAMGSMQGWWAQTSTAAYTSTAWRPPYQPQLGHTTWGSLAWRHWGQTLRGGSERRQADARRLRLLALEVFFLGTAIGGLS
jgi:hypothetical protein